MTLALTGSSQGKTEPRKATYKEMRHNEKPSILLERTPATRLFSSGKSPGDLAVEMAIPKGTNNLTEGTKKNELRVKGQVESPCRLDEKMNPLSSGRTDRNWSEVFREHSLESEHD